MKVKDLIYLLMSRGELEDDVWCVSYLDGREIIAPLGDNLYSISREAADCKIKEDNGQCIIYLGLDFEEELQLRISENIKLIKSLDSKVKVVKKKVKKK